MAPAVSFGERDNVTAKSESAADLFPVPMFD
jgi:hypothetical protein